MRVSTQTDQATTITGAREAAVPAQRRHPPELVAGSAAYRPDPSPSLSFDATVPRMLVHRAAVAEVFVTDSVWLGDSSYQVAAQLPRGHYIGEDPARYDFQILVEVLRQAGVLIAHSHLDVSIESPFIFRGLSVHIVDLDQLRIGDAPGKAVVHTTVHPERTSGGRMRGLAFEGGAELGGKPMLHGEGRLLFVGKGSYDALRRRGREQKLARQRPAALAFTPARPDTVGRRNPRNVVITEPTPLADRRLAASMVIDRTHPYLFDHPLDHVPGNLSVEACRQLAVAAVSREYGLAPESLAVVDAEIEFGEFAEHDLIIRVVAETGELGHHEATGALAAPVRVELTQAGSSVAAAKLQVAAWS